MLVRKFILGALIFFSFFVFVADASAQEDGLYLSEESAKSLSDDIKLLNIQLEAILERNDSLAIYNDLLISNNFQLNNKLKAQRFKNELFEGVLAEQTMRFVLITLGIIIFGVVFAIYAIRDKGKQLERKYNQAIEDMLGTNAKTLTKQSNLEQKLFNSLANINFTLGRQYSQEGDLVASINYGLKSAEYIHKTIVDSEGKLAEKSSATSIGLLSLLTTIINYLNTIAINDENIERFRLIFPDLLDSLSEMVNSPIREINNSATLIKSKLIKLESL